MRSNNFSRNILKLLGGSAIIHGINLIFQPLVRRLYTIEAFGSLSVYTSLVSILISVIALRYPLAIYLPQSDKKAQNLVFLSWLIALFTCSVLFIVISIKLDFFTGLLKIEVGYRHFFLFLPLTLLFLSLSDTYQHYLTRKNSIDRVVYSKISKRFTDSALGIVFGKLRLTGGIFYSELLGNITQFFVPFLIQRKPFPTNETSISNLIKVAVEYKKYPLLNGLPSLLNTISIGLPVIIVSMKFGPIQTGYFDFTKMALAIPIALVSNSISKAILQEMSQKFRRKSSVLKVFTQLSLGLISFGIVLIVLTLIAIDPLVELIFGSKWLPATSIIKILVFSFAVKLVVSPLSFTLTALDKIRLASTWQVGYFILIASLMFIKASSLLEFVRYYLLVDIFSYLSYYFLIARSIISYEKSISK